MKLYINNSEIMIYNEFNDLIYLNNDINKKITEIIITDNSSNLIDEENQFFNDSLKYIREIHISNLKHLNKLKLNKLSPLKKIFINNLPNLNINNIKKLNHVKIFNN